MEFFKCKLFLKGMGIIILKLGKNSVLIDRYCLNQGISSLIWKCTKNINRLLSKYVKKSLVAQF